MASGKIASLSFCGCPLFRKARRWQDNLQAYAKIRRLSEEEFVEFVQQGVFE